MTLARLSGGPLDGQLIPLEDEQDETYIAAYGEGQLVYRRGGPAIHTGTDDGPTEVSFVYVEGTEDIDPDPDGRDE